jgi:hypothetical protein
MTAETKADGKPFIHYHAAHCESGITASLFKNMGVDISEGMAFGIGSGIFFGYLPFVKMRDLPISTFRSRPKSIFRKVARRLGADFVAKTFRDPRKGNDELKKLLKGGHLVALSTNIYWLPYLSQRFRWNFSGHNIIVIREIENGFRISDSMLDHPVDCPAADLERARFAQGPQAAHGYLFYLKSVNPDPDLRGACIKAMKDSCNMMLKIPLPIFGVRGIRFLARKTIKSPEKLGFDEACRHLAATVRWLEEIGTGGSGFRYMYAAFLQEAAGLFGSAGLADLSEEMTSIGHDWREFAVVAVRIIKQRDKASETFAKAGGLMMKCADREEAFFRRLQNVARQLKA